VLAHISGAKVEDNFVSFDIEEKKFTDNENSQYLQDLAL